LALGLIAQDEFSFGKAEEEGVAVVTPTDDNAADGNSGKQLAKMSGGQCTNRI
jgi:hypothetical protein